MSQKSAETHASAKRFRALVAADVMLLSVRDILLEWKLSSGAAHLDMARAEIVRDLESLQDAAYAYPGLLQLFKDSDASSWTS